MCCTNVSYQLQQQHQQQHKAPLQQPPPQQSLLQKQLHCYSLANRRTIRHTNAVTATACQAAAKTKTTISVENLNLAALVMLAADRRKCCTTTKTSTEATSGTTRTIVKSRKCCDNTTTTTIERTSATALTTTPSTTSRRSSRTKLLYALLLLLCFLINYAAVEAADSLLGDLQSCSNEGEEVHLKGIKNSKCFKCTCKNGFVKCDKDSCPSIDDCYLLETGASDSCCRRCKGCVHRGIAYASGSEWSDPEDPCRVFKCIASVVTETTLKCYTQCEGGSENTQQRPGECCASCQGCKINGQLVAEGQEVVASIDDRCLVCQCTDSRLSCVKKTCPILQCPISKQIRMPDECCPRCSEHREFMQVTGKCIFNRQLYFDKVNFWPDRCSNCTCVNGTSLCYRDTCPILDCSPEYQEMDGCCPRCLTAEVRSECIYNGTAYQNNETWNMGPCRSCRCNGGNIRCSEMRCPAVKCRSDEEMKVTEGECCPRCIEMAGTCTVFGDPHFKTFDGKFYSFQGSCKYLLAADCRDHSFSIRLTNDGRGTKRSSWTKTITLKLKGGVRVNFGQKLRVKINGSRIAMPYSNGSILSIERMPEGVMLKTDLGLTIEWDGNNFLQIAVPSSYKGKMCGLCGNYNGYGRDDLIGRTGSNHTDAVRFANSWRVGGPKACSRRNENVQIQPTCKQRTQNAFCHALRESEVFGNCDNRLNPNNYFESCKMDVCECPSKLCHCDSFAAYAHECRRLGVELPDWRTATNCPVGMWQRNVTLAAQTALQHNARYAAAVAASVGGRQQHAQKRRRKGHKAQQLLQQHNQLESDFITKHVPKNLLSKSIPQGSPPPLH